MSSQDLFAKLRHRGSMDETELTGLHRSTSLSIDKLKPNTNVALLGLSDLMGGEDSHLFKTHDEVKLADTRPSPAPRTWPWRHRSLSHIARRPFRNREPLLD